MHIALSLSKLRMAIENAGLHCTIFHNFASSLLKFQSFCGLDETHESDATEWWYNMVGLTINNFVEPFKHTNLSQVYIGNIV